MLYHYFVILLVSLVLFNELEKAEGCTSLLGKGKGKKGKGGDGEETLPPIRTTKSQDVSTPDGGRTTPDGGNTTPGGATTPSLLDCLGDGAKFSGYEDDGFLSSGGSADTPQDLTCNFDSDCCWTNDAQSDELDFGTGEFTDPSKAEECLGLTSSPSGKFAFVCADKGEDTVTAKFVSCAIECASGDIKVSLKHWHKGVDLAVCTASDAFGDNPKETCTALGEGPGPDQITLPGGTDVEIIIKATFAAGDSGCAAIDDISVDYTNCDDDKDKDKDEKTPDQELCDAIACDFESNKCNYVPLSGDWDLEIGKIGNQNTGVLEAAEGIFYYGTKINKGDDKAALQATGLPPVPDNRAIKFFFYEATEKVKMTMCQNDDCEFQSDPDIKISDRRWKQAWFPINKRADEILFECENFGNNFGACGLDGITVVDTISGESVC